MYTKLGEDHNDANPLPVFETNKRERHGTPIAGIIGALNNNSTGVVGIAGGWETIESGVQLYSFRVSSDNVNSNGDRLIDRSLIPEAIIEIAADPSINDGFGYGCHVINCSFACSPQGVYFDNCNYWDWNTLTGRTTYWAYHTAFWLNATIVAGRGNEGNDDPVFPATYSNGGILMSISALDHNGDLFDNWWMSSFGDGVTLSAPGEIGSTTAVNENGNTYNFFSGTSNAAPFVSGTAALVLSRLHERNIYSFSEDIRNIIQIGANNVGLSGYDESLGWGRLDAGQSLHIVSPPFNLEHYTIPYEDLDIEEVTFPGSTLCLYIPFKCAFVKNVYRVRGTFNIPDKYQELDSVWVWANSFTTGLNWGNPSWGTPDATLISRVNRELIFETYIYKLLDIDGSQTYLWPPSDVPRFISLSLLGKDNSCIEDLYLTNIFIDKYDYYKAKNLISAENNVILSSNSDVSFKAGQEIILGPGFSVIEGGIFSAKIEDCYLDELKLLKNSIHFNSDKVSDIKSNTLTIHPNPFDDVTRISVNLTEPSEIRLEVFDLLGNRVAIITSGEHFPIGSHDFTFSGHQHTSGVYYLKLTSNKELISRQLLLIK